MPKTPDINGQFSEWRRLILDKLDTNTSSIKEMDKDFDTFKLKNVEKIAKLEGKINAQKRSTATWALIGSAITTGVGFVVYLILRLTNAF